MSKKKKIGVGITTYNRLEYLRSLINSLIPCEANIDELVVVNDGGSKPNWDLPYGKWINNHSNFGISRTKNIIFKHLLNQDCDYIFLIEDDVIIRDSSVFERYIEASNITGIQHFNYGPGTPFNRKQKVQFDIHNRSQLDQRSDPNPRLSVQYSDSFSLDLYTHVAGMFSFFTKRILEKVGLFDEDYINAWEHVDHTYRIIKAGAHPPFWWFADLHNSNQYLDEQQEAIKNSSTSNSKEWMENVLNGQRLYISKHGHAPNNPPPSTQSDVLTFLKSIKP